MNLPRNSYALSIADLLTTSGSMTQNLRRLTSECYLDRLRPALTNHFVRIDHVFKLFCNQANESLRTKQDRFSPLPKTAEFLVSERVDFVSGFNSLASQGLSPHHDHFTSLFTSLLEHVDEIQGLFDSRTFRTLASPYSFSRIKAEVASLERLPVTDATFPSRVGALAIDVAEVFRRSVATWSMSTGKVMHLRASLNALCTELVRVATGIALFPELVALTRLGIAQTTRQLDMLLESLGMPLGVRLHFDELQEGEETPPREREPPKVVARQRAAQNVSFAVGAN
jgi:hypothetical protein